MLSTVVFEDGNLCGFYCILGKVSFPRGELDYIIAEN